jgi:hypothetical protein
LRYKKGTRLAWAGFKAAEEGRQTTNIQYANECNANAMPTNAV